jgi:transcriptional regulator with XRE-family HTH domain
VGKEKTVLKGEHRMNLQPNEPSIYAPAGPNGTGEIDAHIGARLRAARLRSGLSQENLAGRLGITFQQIQKYEKGTNRISASRLLQIATVLNMPVADFFTGLERTTRFQGSDAVAPPYAGPQTGLEQRWLDALRSIRRDEVRRKLVQLATELATSE